MKRPIVPVPALLAATALASIGPPSANAGVYRAAVCNPELAALHPDAIFARTSRHYLSDASCGEGQAGLAVRHQGKRTGQGRWGGWTVRAPRGTVISHLGVSAAGRRAGGQVPQLLTAPLAGPLQPFWVPDPGMERSRWNGRARSFVARLVCARDGGCGSGDRSGIRVKRLSLRMADRARPRIALSGRAFGPGSKRGIQAMQAIASDVGAGIHRFLLQVNGEPVAAHASACRAADGFALRLRPCPLHARTTFKAATTWAPFRQGPNTVRICTVDYGLDTQANRACAERHVRVDNLCPISSAGPGPVLEAHISRTRSATERGEAAVRGRLRSPAGKPVAGARVCVATRVPLAGAGEHIAATPVTGEDGRFKRAAPIRSEQAGPRRLLVERYRGRGAPPRPPRPCPPATEAATAPRRPQRPPGPLQGPAPGARGAAPVGSDPGAIGQALDRGEQRPHKPARCLPRSLPLPLDLGPTPVRLQGGRPEPAGLPVPRRALQDPPHHCHGLGRGAACAPRDRHGLPWGVAAGLVPRSFGSSKWRVMNL